MSAGAWYRVRGKGGRVGRNRSVLAILGRWQA